MLTLGFSCVTLATASFANTNVQPQMTTQQIMNAQWVYMDVVNNEFKLWYSPLSVHTVQKFTGKQFQQAWFKQEIVNDLNPQDNVNIGDYSLDLWRADCTTRKVGMVKSLFYKKTGVFVHQTRIPYIYMKETVPSTAGEAILNRICANVVLTS